MGICYDGERGLFILESSGMAYSLGIDEMGNLQHLYWGKSLPYLEDYPRAFLPKEYGFDGPLQRIKEEYPPWGGMRFKEGALKVHYPGGERDLVLHYRDHRLKEEELTISLFDPVFQLLVHLHYRLHPPFPIIERFSRVENRTRREVILTKSYSGALHLPPLKEYRLSYLSGEWVGESRLTRILLSPGKKVLESRRGSVGHRLHPFFAIDDGRANEGWGLVYYGALAYSGSFRLVLELEEGLQVVGGINDFDFSLTLQEGEIFTTPSLICGLSLRGFEEMSHHLHQFQQENLILKEKRKRPLPVIYNSWEVEGFSVTQKRQQELARRAKELGVEIFVLDDGWFLGRDSDKRGLGDWTVDKSKFPQGLEPLITYVKNLGMGFGLWVEPEMVNPDSLLFKNHPHWVYHFPSRTPSLYRNQLVLNLGLKEVRLFIKKTLDRLIGELELDFIKWDFNRHISEPGAIQLPLKRQQEIWYRHIEGLYGILSFLRRKYPYLLIEACSGGGGRIDLGISPYVDQFWVSDNTDPYDRLLIQDGFSLVYAPCTMGAWITDSPNWLTKRSTPLQYRFHVAMMGALGIGGDLLNWSLEDRTLAKEMVEQYKGVREVIQRGYLYRLLPIGEGPLTAVEYLSRDREEVLVFLFLMGEHFGPHTSRVLLRGLDEKRIYQGHGESLSGTALMERGLLVSLGGDFQSSLMHLKAR